jgi:hypothetical protein
VTNKYILTSIIDKNNKDAGPKAKRDIDFFLSQEGYQKLDLNLPTKRIAKIKYVLFKLKRVFKKLEIDEIIIQYPIYSMFLTQKIIQAIRKYSHGKIYFIVHDIETLRDQKDNAKFIRDERELFNNVDGLIVHNRSMRQWCQDNGIKTPMVELGLFDYLNEQDLQENDAYKGSFCYAGNLQKADFLTKLILVDTTCAVFGNNQASSYPRNVNYQGSYLPEELPKYLKQNFGLVWDGDSLETCTGIFGEYTKYNAPHKTSLYLSTAIPVIVWQKAAVAEFVKEQNVGIVVNNLTNIEETLQQITAKQYLELKQNAMNVAVKLRQGAFIKQALHKLKQKVAC